MLEKKLEILREERQLLDEEITENRILGRQVTIARLVSFSI